MPVSKWLPIISKQGMIYFYDKSTGNVQYTYPKEYDTKAKKYVSKFFKNWKKTKVPNKPNEYYWINKDTNLIQTVKPSSTTFILEACLLDNFAFVELYIEYNGNINITDSNKRNCVHYAVMNDNDKMVKLLIKLSCDIDKKDKDGNTPLHYAILYRSYKCMKILVDNGSNINEINNKGESIMHLAVRNRNVKLIYYLIQNKAEITVKNKKGEFPIDYAVKDNDWGMVKILTKLSKVVIAEKELEEEEEEKEEEESLTEEEENEEEEINMIDIKKSIKSKKSNILELLQDTERSKKKKKSKLLLSGEKEIEYYDDRGRFKGIKARMKRKEDKSNTISIDEINFLRESVTQRNEAKKLKVKSTQQNLFEEDYKKIKQEKIAQYKQNLTHRSSSSSISTNNTSMISFSSISTSLSAIYSKASSCLLPVLSYAKYFSIEFYNFTKSKAKRMLKYSDRLIQNIKIYINTPPDIENQIDYINYMSSSLDSNNDFHIRAQNEMKRSYISERDLKTIESVQIMKSQEMSNYSKKEIIHNCYRQRISNRYHCIFNPNKDKHYVYAIPKYLLYKHSTDKLSSKKYHNLLNLYKSDLSFTKSLRQYYRRMLNKKTKPIKHFLSYIKQIKSLSHPIDYHPKTEENVPLSNRSNNSAYENIIQSLNNINRIIDTATSTRSFNTHQKMKSQILEMDDDTHWDNLDLTNNIYNRTSTNIFDNTEKDESIDLEKIINEYNTKLNMIKKENVMMSNQASFSIIDNKKKI